MPENIVPFFQNKMPFFALPAAFLPAFFAILKCHNFRALVIRNASVLNHF
jgi:hypothetical protein